MLEDLIKLFATDKEEFSKLISKESSENIKILFEEILKYYINDLNSSTLRELVTCSVAGYKQNRGKLGYDGVKITNDGNTKYCEVKPKNYIIDHSKSKLNGGGNFTDFSWKKLKKYALENPSMLLSGFVNGELIYIIEFDFNNEGFKERLKEQLLTRFPEGDKTGFWLRSAQFSFKHFKDYEYKKLYVHKNIQNYSKFLTKELFYELNNK